MTVTIVLAYPFSGSTLQLSLHSWKFMPVALDSKRLAPQLVQLLVVPSQVLQLALHLLQCVGLIRGAGMPRPAGHSGTQVLSYLLRSMPGRHLEHLLTESIQSKQLSLHLLQMNLPLASMELTYPD
jgi:hypothetical protein